MRLLQLPHLLATLALCGQFRNLMISHMLTLYPDDVYQLLLAMFRSLVPKSFTYFSLILNEDLSAQNIIV